MKNPPYVIVEPERFRRGSHVRDASGTCCLLGELADQMGTEIGPDAVAAAIGCEAKIILSFERRFEGWCCKKEDPHALLRELCAKFPDKLLLIPRSSQRPDSVASTPRGVASNSPSPMEDEPQSDPVGQRQALEAARA